MAFLTTDDFTSRVYAEKINAISRGDITLLPTAINEAIAEAKLALSRFDLTDLFGQAGDARDPILLRWLKDIALWQFIGLANPGLDYDDTELRRNNAIAGLNKIQASGSVPAGWKLAASTDGGITDPSTSLHAGSLHCKRDTYRGNGGSECYPWQNQCNY